MTVPVQPAAARAADGGDAIFGVAARGSSPGEGRVERVHRERGQARNAEAAPIGPMMSSPRRISADW